MANAQTTHTTTTITTTLTGPLTLLQAAAVAQWYEELAPALRRFVAGVLLHTRDDGQEVEDILHETFMRVIRDSARVATLSAAHRRNYVWNTAKWAARDYGRTRATRYEDVPLSALLAPADAPMEPVTASHDWQTHATGIEQTTAARMTLKAVWEATPPEHRELLALLAQGYTPVEMAARLGITRNGVNMRVWRLRQLLRAAGEALS